LDDEFLVWHLIVVTNGPNVQGFPSLSKGQKYKAAEEAPRAGEASKRGVLHNG